MSADEVFATSGEGKDKAQAMEAKSSAAHAEADAAHRATTTHDGKKNSATMPEQFVDDLEAMGPTYVKLGQVLAGRPDLMPAAYRAALARLQDKVKPFPYEQVEEIIVAELGVRISKAFSRFDREPVAAASLGQVHLAALRDGRPVVVKVQRPDVRPQIAEDFEVLEQLAKTMDAHTKLGRRHRLSAIVEEFRLTLLNELNYEREAQNLIAVGNNLAEFERIQVPRPILDYTTRNVLTMEYVTGRKITSLSPLARLEVNGAELCEELFRAYLKQVLVDGIFHADPHPGNVFLTAESRIALLDLGMVGHTAPKKRPRNSTPRNLSAKSASSSPAPATRASPPSRSVTPSSKSPRAPAKTACTPRASSPSSARRSSSSTRSAASSPPTGTPMPPSAAMWTSS
jgi:predicted unusual protein kinase regulating ubiquinone biosynthesis (AarF/ABC1/UbiB family)